jgi:hypothetical protein
VPHPQPPLDWWSDRTGLSVSLSSWDADATMVTFFCSPSKRAAHEHRDNNSFSVFRSAPLLLDAGHYDLYATPHYRDYYSRTIAHNSICVYDSSERFTSFGTAAANDGGQIDAAAMMNYQDIFKPANQRGRWLRRATGTGYAYSAADATLSYDPAKLDYVRRRLLYLKPDRIVVLDHMHQVNTATRQRDPFWVAHFAQRPELSGAPRGSSVPGHIETFAAGDCSARNKGGSVALRTLLPHDASVTRIGGTGYEYWADGANHPLVAAYDTTLCTPGAWRIEVHALPTADTLLFLHTIAVGDTIAPARPGGALLEGPTSVGVDWNDTLLVFSRSGVDSVSGHFLPVCGGGRIAHILAFDLLPGVYRVLVGGYDTGETRADDSGIASTDVPIPPGTHSVELRTDVTVVGEEHSSSPSLAVLWPNPARGEVHVRPLDRAGQQLTLTLFDVLGKVVLQRTVDGAGGSCTFTLPTGVYMGRIANGAGIEWHRIVVLR